MTTDTRTDGTVLRKGQEVSLSDLDDDRVHHFVVVDSDGRDVTARSASRLRTPFAVGSEVRVRYSVIDDASYQGRVRLTSATDEGGCPEYQFRLPDDMDRLQARNFRRLALLADDVTATLSEVGGTGQCYEGQIMDISAGGAGVMVTAGFEVGETVRVRCQLDPGGIDIDVEAEVVRASTDGGQYGLKFVGLRPVMEDKIVAFVLRQALQRS
jgi:c-di-GMP-binding flagellar brake protein YcgR